MERYRLPSLGYISTPRFSEPRQDVARVPSGTRYVVVSGSRAVFSRMLYLPLEALEPG